MKPWLGWSVPGASVERRLDKQASLLAVPHRTEIRVSRPTPMQSRLQAYRAKFVPQNDTSPASPLLAADDVVQFAGS